MGFFDKLVKAVGDTITDVLKDSPAPAETVNMNTGANEEPAEAPVAPPVETPVAPSEPVSKQWGFVPDDFPDFVRNFPAWNFCKIVRTDYDEGADYKVYRIGVHATLEMIQQYHRMLVSEGFSDTDQIQRKKIDGIDYLVDFTFADYSSEDCEIGYGIEF